MAEHGYNTTLKYDTTEVEKIDSITPPSMSVNDVDTSHMTSTDQARTFEAGWKDAGEVNVTKQFVADEQTTLYAMVGVTESWTITFSDGSTVVFDGYIKGFGNPVEREGLTMIDFTIKASGLPVFATGSV